MAQNKYALAFGTTLGYAVTPVVGAYTLLAGIDSIGGMPTLTFDETEITRIDQAGIIKQFASTLADPGTLDFVIGFDKAQVATVLGMAGALKGWQITFSEGSTLTFDGWIKQFGNQSESANGEMLVHTIVRVTGGLTFTAAT